MKKRTLFLGIVAAFVTLSAVNGAVFYWNRGETISAPIDLSAVSKIRVNGAASMVTISTQKDKPFTGQMIGRRDGWGALWHSGWSARDCPQSGTMQVDGDTLVVETSGLSKFFDWSDCTLELSANVRPGSAVLIRQQAARMTLSGDYSTVQVNADAGDFALDGHADTLDISGAALRARAVFETVLNTETINLSGKMMDATLRFMSPTAVSYLVEATASYIDSSLPNTPGAKPAITIRGEMVRATIK
ncbi:hypothetical protein [Rhizobium sp.]|jgi:hypothetical protein|uniref:hypothetical protein n=1 Tax=Rhizobium sp. TaxID=391 RepID=UPI000E8806D4|nr:hypothetical protein [Rhizobium sp.]